MPHSSADERSEAQRARDEEIASQPQLPPLDLAPDADAAAVEHHLGRPKKRPLAVAGVVENGLVRPLDPAVKLPEHARVIIVTAESAAES